MSKKTDTGLKSNQTSSCSILDITYVVATLFLGLTAYLGYFLQMESKDVINNSYNAKLGSSSDHVARGRILASDGTVLVQTQMGGEENGIRVYPFGDIFDHVVGYSTKGKAGIEALANFYLLTSHANLMEQMGNELTGNKNPGDDIYTTLDAESQQAIYTALGTRRGVVIVMEPDAGKIFAIVSKPGYGPNSLPGDWEALAAQENKEGQLSNRVIQGFYSPGPTFKMVTALEYMRERPADYKNYQFNCDGVYENGEYQIKCCHGTAHGHQDSTLAFANSCNGALVSLGFEMDPGRWNSTAGELLFNESLLLSRIPYKQSAYDIKPGTGTWETLQASIGQGIIQVTPLHSAMVTAATADGGTLMRPCFLDSVVNAGDETIKKFMPAAYGSFMSAEEAVGLTELMRAVITEGTGPAVRTDVYTVAAKTGSVEFETGREIHAWFTGFAPAEPSRLVVTVLVEGGGSKGRAAAPIARRLFDIYVGR